MASLACGDHPRGWKKAVLLVLCNPHFCGLKLVLDSPIPQASVLFLPLTISGGDQRQPLYCPSGLWLF